MVTPEGCTTQWPLHTCVSFLRTGHTFYMSWSDFLLSPESLTWQMSTLHHHASPALSTMAGSPIFLSTQIPPVRKPVHDNPPVYPKPGHFDRFCHQPGANQPMSCQFGGLAASQLLSASWPLKSPTVFPSAFNPVFSLHPPLHCCLRLVQGPARGCRWQLLEVGHLRTHLR